MGLAGNDLANGFEIVIICLCAGSTGREEEMGGVTKERGKEVEYETARDGERRIVLEYSTIQTNKHNQNTITLTDTLVT